MPGKKSMLKREEYVVGGLTKAFVPVAKRVAKIFEEDVTEKEIKTKLIKDKKKKNELERIESLFRQNEPM